MQCCPQRRSRTQQEGLKAIGTPPHGGVDSTSSVAIYVLAGVHIPLDATDLQADLQHSRFQSHTQAELRANPVTVTGLSGTQQHTSKSSCSGGAVSLLPPKHSATVSPGCNSTVCRACAATSGADTQSTSCVYSGSSPEAPQDSSTSTIAYTCQQQIRDRARKHPGATNSSIKAAPGAMEALPTQLHHLRTSTISRQQWLHCTILQVQQQYGRSCTHPGNCT